MKKGFLILLFGALLFPNCGKNDDPSPIVPIDFTVPGTKDIIMYEINIGSFRACSGFHD